MLNITSVIDVDDGGSIDASGAGFGAGNGRGGGYVNNRGHSGAGHGGRGYHGRLPVPNCSERECVGDHRDWIIFRAKRRNDGAWIAGNDVEGDIVHSNFSRKLLETFSHEVVLPVAHRVKLGKKGKQNLKGNLVGGC